MMRKMMTWVMAATLIISGLGVLTACSSSSDDGEKKIGNLTPEMLAGVWVTDNTVNGQDNIYLYNTVITVTGKLDGSKIGVRMEKPGTFTSGYSANNKDVSPITIFVSDDDAYNVILTDNEGELKKKMETAVKGIEDAQGKIDGIWYDLNGRKIANGQKPTAKGIYLNNGRKVVVK